MSEVPWNNWYHLTAHTYGSWLRGDPRGWRTRHHREHVEGDYRNPPPRGSGDRVLALSQRLMKRDPVTIARDLRKLVVVEIASKLESDEIEVVVAALDARHLHVLARFPDHNPRHWLGRAKKNASHVLRQQGWRIEEGGLWAKRSHATPIVDRRHQLQVFRYIHGHRHRGAATWTLNPQRSPDPR